jgi:hypothetical protein
LFDLPVEGSDVGFIRLDPGERHGEQLALVQRQFTSQGMARPETPKMSLTTSASLMSAASSSLIRRRRSDPWFSTRVRR